MLTNLEKSIDKKLLNRTFDLLFFKRGVTLGYSLILST